MTLRPQQTNVRRIASEGLLPTPDDFAAMCCSQMSGFFPK
jgi:hypothetical protein